MSAFAFCKYMASKKKISFPISNWLSIHFSLYSVTEVIRKCLWCGKPIGSCKFWGLIFVGWGYGVVGRETVTLFYFSVFAPFI